MVSIYSTGCPRCKVLEKKLEAAGIEYELVNFDPEDLIAKNYTTVPLLETETGELLDFTAAIKWINKRLEEGIKL